MHYHREGNGTLLQYSGLENPRDRGAWWAPVYGVPRSRTRLKRLSSSSSSNALSGFLCGSAGKESACNMGDLGLIPELRRSPGEGKGYLFQHSGVENSMDCTVESMGLQRVGHN